MIKLNGAYQNMLGNICCGTCGSAMKTWENIATESSEKGQIHVFRCKRCKKRIEIHNTRE